MKIRINGNEVVLEKAVSLKELLVMQNVRMPEYVTVQLNDEFVSTSSFENTLINDGDEIEFLYFMGGGQANK
ncbi:sulfur carrier protein ThiS [Paradesulfitobacterium aromaticivorans]